MSSDGDEEALSELRRRHRRAGLRFAQLVAPEHDPEKLVLAAYHKTLELLDDAHSLAGPYRLHLYREIVSLAGATPEAYDAASNSAVIDATQVYDSLPDRWQAALWYSEVEQMSPHHIAPLLGYTPNDTLTIIGLANTALSDAASDATGGDFAMALASRFLGERAAVALIG